MDKKLGKALKLNWSTPNAFKKVVDSKKINYKGATIQTKLTKYGDACSGFYKSMVYALYYNDTYDSISVNAKTFDWRTFQPGDGMLCPGHIEMFWCYTDDSKNARYSEWNSDCKYAVIMTGNPGDTLDIDYYAIDSATGKVMSGVAGATLKSRNVIFKGVTYGEKSKKICIILFDLGSVDDSPLARSRKDLGASGRIGIFTGDFFYE